MKKIKLGISACLLGENVRYDGGHRRDRYLADTLERFVKYVPVCPEVECGFGVPRETIRLAGKPGSARVLTSCTQCDVTSRMVRLIRARLKQLAEENLCGFVFKSGSPSCGPKSVKVYGEKGRISRAGVGVFARMFMQRFPLLPIEDEKRLLDAAVRENFVQRIFAASRRLKLVERKKSRAELTDFHADHALLIMAHSPDHARRLDKLLAGAREKSLKKLYDAYFRLFTEALKRRATVNKNARVFARILSAFKDRLAAGEKREMLEAIEAYGEGRVPFVAPATLANRCARKYDLPHLKRQLFLNPHPAELALRRRARGN